MLTILTLSIACELNGHRFRRISLGMAHFMFDDMRQHVDQIMLLAASKFKKDLETQLVNND